MSVDVSEPVVRRPAREHAERLRWAQPVAFVVVAILVAQVTPLRYLNALVLFSIYAYISVCWNFVGGLGGKLSLAHGAFFGLGAYISAVLYVDQGVPMLVGGLVAAVTCGICAWLIAAIAFRRQIGALYFALLTLAFAYILLELVHQYEVTYKLLGVQIPLENSPGNLLFVNRYYSFYVGIALVACVLAVWLWITSHRFGFMLAAAREDEAAAQALGVNVPAVFTWTMVLSGAATSLAGVLAAGYLLSIEANFIMSFEWMNIVLAATIVGGLGRTYGPIVGAAFVTVIGEIVRNLPDSVAVGGVSTIVYGTLLLLAMVLLPSGITGLGERVRMRRSA